MQVLSTLGVQVAVELAARLEPLGAVRTAVGAPIRYLFFFSERWVQLLARLAPEVHLHSGPALEPFGAILAPRGNFFALLRWLCDLLGGSGLLQQGCSGRQSGGLILKGPRRWRWHFSVELLLSPIPFQNQAIVLEVPMFWVDKVHKFTVKNLQF